MPIEIFIMPMALDQRDQTPKSSQFLSSVFNVKYQKSILRTTTKLLAVIFLVHAASGYATTNTTANEQGIPVTTVQAHAVEWPITLAAEGEIIPWEVAVVSAKTNGFSAIAVDVVAGDRVKKGQRLAQFDSRLLKAELNQAKANLALAEANLKLAHANLERVAQLQKQQLLSDQDYDAAENQASTARAARDQAHAALALAQIKLDDATLIAPDDGQILERNINLGEVPAAGAALFTLLRQNKLQWLATINAADLARVKIDMPADIQLLSGQTISGTVRSISTQLTHGTRLGIVHVILNGSSNLPVNSYAQGHLLLGSAAAIAVPAECLVIKDGKTWVFRLNNQRAEQLLVTLGRRKNGEIEIISDLKNGIKSGDTLVREGAGFLNNGDLLSVKNTAANVGTAQ